MITKIIIDEMKTAVVRDGKHAYYEVGGDINIRDEADNLLKPVSLTAVAADKIADKCDVKTSGTKYKCGYSAVDLGIKDRTTGKTIVVEPYRIVGLIIDKDKITYETIETADTKSKSLSSDNAVSLFKYCTLKYVPINSGVAVRHSYKKELAKDFPQYKHYGMLWRCGDKDVLKHIEPDMDNDTHFHKTADGFIEYFSVDNFHDQNPETGVCDGPLHDVVHNYTTVAGTLTGNVEWTAGTYYLGTVYTSTYTITLNCAAGNIYIKSAGAVNCIQPSADGGKVITANTDSTHKVIWTSMNDDTRGETIAGSSGSPSIADYAACIFWLADTDSVLSWLEVHYCGTNRCCFSHGFNNAKANCNVTLSHVIFKNCAVVEGAANYGKAFIGHYRYVVAIGVINLSYIEIDETNTLEHAGYANCFRTGTGGYAGYSIDTAYITPVNNGCLAVMFGQGLPGGATFKNMYVKMDGECNGNFLFQFRILAGINGTINIFNCVFDGVSTDNTKMNYYFYSGGAGYTMAINMLNCVSMNCGNATASVNFANGVGTYAGSVNKCVYYNNTADFDSAHGTTNDNPIAADPQLSMAPAGSTILATSPFSGKSVVVTNLAALEKQGSDTFDNLSWNEAVYSATGYGYAGTDKVTPGLMIEWSAFVQRILRKPIQNIFIL